VAGLPARDWTYMKDPLHPMKELLFELLDRLDATGSQCPSHTRVFALTLLRMLSPQDRYDTLQFLLEFTDPPPAPKPPLRLLQGGLS